MDRELSIQEIERGLSIALSDLNGPAGVLARSHLLSRRRANANEAILDAIKAELPAGVVDWSEATPFEQLRNCKQAVINIRAILYGEATEDRIAEVDADMVVVSQHGSELPSWCAQNCAKCGSSRIVVRYCDGRREPCDRPHPVCGRITWHRDHLYLRCEGCNYRWNEPVQADTMKAIAAILDAAEAKLEAIRKAMPSVPDNFDDRLDFDVRCVDFYERVRAILDEETTDGS